MIKVVSDDSRSKEVGDYATISIPGALAQGKVIEVYQDGSVTIDPKVLGGGLVSGKPN